MLQAELKVIGGRQNGKRLTLAKKFLVGREQDCHLRPNSDMVSRHHCMFSLDDYTLRLRDLGSTNGTYVNDERLEGQIMLKTGDQVRIGKLEFEVIVNEVAELEEVPADDQFELEDDSRILAPEQVGPSSSETMVDVKLPLPEETDQPTEQFQQEAAGDTGTIPTYNPQQQPGWPQQQPGYFPQMPPGYYPPQGMPYPPPGYPPQYYPPQPQYPGEAPPPPPAEETSEAQGNPLHDVRLPDPSETGVKDTDIGSGGGGKKSGGEDPNPSNKAAELLNKMKNRR